MPSPKLKDYERWKKLNTDKNFSLFDYLYHVLKIGNLSTDIWFAIREVFWPEFIEYKEFVLIKAMFSQEKVEQLLQQGQQVEFWFNLLTLDPYFEDGENMEERAELLGGALVETWKAKLSQDFPSRKFVVKLVCDKEVGDYGVTFYQQVVV